MENSPPQSRICPLCSGEHFGSFECPFRCERCKVNTGQCFEEGCPRSARWRAEQEAAEKTGTLFAASESRSQDPAQSVPDGMWYFTFYCEDRASVERMRVIADAPRQFTCGVTGIAKKEKANG